MTGAKIDRSPDARRDAARLALWIGRESGVDRAQAVMDRLEAALMRLARRPRLGRVRRDLKGEPRSFPVGPWSVIYEPLKDSGGILVLRILDSRRDIAALMGKKS
jgi:plasmid stabilization system protein ParE